MSSTSGKMEVDQTSTHRSRERSTDTLRTSRESNRSPSRDGERDKDRKDRRRDKGDEDKRRLSRSREKYSDRGHRDDRSRDHQRERDRSDRDRDRDRRRGDRDIDRGHRDSRSYRDREREREDYRDRDRRRKRGEEEDRSDRGDDRSKRKRSDEVDEAPPPPNSAPPPPPPTDSPRSVDRRNGDKRYRDEVEDSPRFRDRRDRRRRDYDDKDKGRRTRSPQAPGPISPRAPVKRNSPIYDGPPPEEYNPDEPKDDDSEARSVFVSQLAARLTARDLGYFFEDKLGEGTVMDARIVTDRLSRRSKGIGYVEFRTIDLVEKAISLSGTIVMNLPINVQLTESERNKSHAGDGSLHLPPGVTASHGAILYVGSLHFNLTESDIKQVFEPFGELEFVDLHRDPMTGRSKGYAFVQYKKPEDARMALEQMEGFELAGRTLRVNTVHEKGSVRYTQQDSLDDSGGGNLNAASRQALMQKLARTEHTAAPAEPSKPNIPQSMQSRSVLLKNMFDPEEESETNWDNDLAEDVKSECESKYGKVLAIKVEKDSQGEIYVKFDEIDFAKKAIQALNGRWFGGRQIAANFISDAIMAAHQ
ncbi:splicing factor, CC1-like protein [Coprinopsis marcescibilis]|uniref:Splicing factor, CC1-like protein n=1 Tax=Coprinopsis marcescibilis TaxID=230819 RepID=A0A5C3LBG8_COPMA|nr:splicing factor, CC1-like protein [Coprinopsis marcescibilis]